MNQILVILSIHVFLFINFKPGFSQIEPGLKRFDLRELGIPDINLIPSDESAITSLILGPNGKIYGGTTGNVCHLFVFAPNVNIVRPLGQINGHQSIHHALAVGKDGMIYIGTGLNEIKSHPISDPMPGREGITKSLWNDIQNRYKKYKGGGLYRYDPNYDDQHQVEIGESALVEKLGIPLPNEGIYTIVASPSRDEIYGITYPHGHFFVYSIDQEMFFDYSQIYQEKVYGGPVRSIRSISRALICAEQGSVFGSSDNQYLFKYDVEARKILILNIQIPHIDIAVVEVFVKDINGLIYGGTSEGFLFSFDPLTEKIINLGKPIDQMRIRALTIGLDGKIYGLAGERDRQCYFFSFNPHSGGYTIFGQINVNRTPHYIWRGDQFDAMTTGLDGTIYVGESQRKSHLFLFFPIY
jgi:hypothetical protein